MIQEAEKTYADEHPYPKEYKTGQKVMEDIDGDGREEEIRYDVKRVAIMQGIPVSLP